VLAVLLAVWVWSSHRRAQLQAQAAAQGKALEASAY